MAQKLAFVLIALLGFANADFAASSSGIVRIFGVPTRATGSLTHDDHDDGPQLGQHGVVLGQEVKLGEEDHHNGQDDEPQYQVVNFVKPVSQVKDNRDDTKADDHDGRLPKSGNHQNGSDRPVRSNGQQRQKGESSRFDRNSQSYRGDKSQKSGWYKQSNSNNAPSKSNENGKSAPIVVVTVSKPEKEQKSNFKPQHQDDHDDHENTQVQIPIFGKLKYVDNDPHGEAVKAPITIVTAPLVSTAQTEHHKVPINEVVGKTNCPECKEQKRESKEHVKSSNKALSKNVDLLTTQIKGPIDNVVVKPEHHDHDESSCEDNDDEDHHHGATHDSHGAAIINQKKLKKDLATGEARENAPFVVGSVVVTSNNNLTHDDDDNDNRRPTNSGRRHD